MASAFTTATDVRPPSRGRPVSVPPPDGDFRPETLRYLLLRDRSLCADVSEDAAPGDLLDLLSDDYARSILAATSVKPMSAKQIAEECGMSEPTVYRRLESLTAHDLVEERTHVRVGGNDYNVYAATLSEFSLRLDEGSYEATVEGSPPPAFPGQDEDDTADRFKEMWENL